jgi:hypothetical protein
MPTATVTSTYAGEFDAQKYISAALLSAPTLEKGLVTIKPNVKYRTTVKNVVTNGLLQDAACDFTDAGTVVLDERVLEPKALMVNKLLCKDDFREDWDAISMGYSAYDNLPPDFQSFLLAHIVKQVAAENEVSVWRGTASAGSFDGFVTKIALDADLPAAQEILGTTVTASNVIAELQSIHSAIPDTLFGNPDLRIYVSQNIYRAYVQALGNLGYVDRFNNQSFGEVVIDGFTVVMVNGLAANTAVATLKSNLWFGTGLLNDTNMVKVIDTSDTLGDENVRIIMRMTAGVQYGQISEIVTYGIVNAANPA